MLALIFFVLWTTGCRTTPIAADGSLAWVEIAGRTPAEINQATATVFQENGYRLATSSSNGATFEKPGDNMKGLAYGTFVGGVLVRVLVSITRQEGTKYLLHCQTFMVRNAGDRVLEDKQKIRFGSAPYQELLDKVKATLAANP